MMSLIGTFETSIDCRVYDRFREQCGHQPQRLPCETGALNSRAAPDAAACRTRAKSATHAAHGAAGAEAPTPEGHCPARATAGLGSAGRQYKIAAFRQKLGNLPR